MRVFSASHGQSLPGHLVPCPPDFSPGDEPLTPLGKEQSRLLGRRLRSMGFSGVIYASPYRRSLETASLIARELGIGFTPLPCLRDAFVTAGESGDYIGLRPQEIGVLYPNAEIPAEMPYPWWERRDDTLRDVIQRLKTGLESVLSDLTQDCDILLIGHKTTMVGLKEIFHPGNYRSAAPWNCSLSLLFETDGDSFAYDISHIPEEMRTTDALIYEEKAAQLERSLREGVRFFREYCGTRILHIGDTFSPHYPHYRRMIELFSPDVIVHTGDLADEIKAGRVEADKPRWEKTVPAMLDILRDSGARCILVYGNNDLPDSLAAMASDLEQYPRNTVLTIAGKRICLGHEVMRIDPSIQADMHLYGHGPTGETRTPSDNLRDGTLYFNTTWGVSLHVPEENAHLVLPAIEI